MNLHKINKPDMYNRKSQPYVSLAEPSQPNQHPLDQASTFSEVF